MLHFIASKSNLSAALSYSTVILNL